MKFWRFLSTYLHDPAFTGCTIAINLLGPKINEPRPVSQSQQKVPRKRGMLIFHPKIFWHSSRPIGSGANPPPTGPPSRCLLNIYELQIMWINGPSASRGWPFQGFRFIPPTCTPLRSSTCVLGCLLTCLHVTPSEGARERKNIPITQPVNPRGRGKQGSLFVDGFFFCVLLSPRSISWLHIKISPGRAVWVVLAFRDWRLETGSLEEVDDFYLASLVVINIWSLFSR